MPSNIPNFLPEKSSLKTLRTISEPLEMLDLFDGCPPETYHEALARAKTDNVFFTAALYNKTMQILNKP